ncbi:MAG: hypothetical protein L0207_00500 [Chlamydiae bacterium]|nr:hypothetical protein [Chlamydiota bacterium]
MPINTVSNSQFFVENFDTIVSTVKNKIEKNQPYIIYKEEIPVEHVKGVASIVLTAMKNHFSKLENQQSNEVSLVGRKLGPNFYACDLRRLYGIFRDSGMTIAMTEEIPPVDPFPQFQNIIGKKIWEITYTTAHFKVTLNDSLKNLVPIKA